MERGALDQFFAEVGRGLTHPMRVYLTGGTVTFPWGGNRPPEGVGFGIHACGPAAMDCQGQLETAGEGTGIPVRLKGLPGIMERLYLPDFKRGAKLYRRFGRLSVYLLDWRYWSLGKLCRNEASDLRDLQVVINKIRPSPYDLIRFWGKTIREGASTLYLPSLVEAVEGFFQKHGREIWGEQLEIARLTAGFRRLVGYLPSNFPTVSPTFGDRPPSHPG